MFRDVAFLCLLKEVPPGYLFARIDPDPSDKLAAYNRFHVNIRFIIRSLILINSFSRGYVRWGDMERGLYRCDIMQGVDCTVHAGTLSLNKRSAVWRSFPASYPYRYYLLLVGAYYYYCQVL